MTLVLSVTGPESIWTVADRRLTYDDGRIVRDNARKIMFLGTTDGVAILSYAGLGATVSDTEPAEWMSAVLRGRNWQLEPSLRALAIALERELPSYLSRFRLRDDFSHAVVVPAFVGSESRLYAIDMTVSADGKLARFQHARLVFESEKAPQRTPRVCFSGSGRTVLSKDMSWRRHVLRLVKAYDRGRVTAETVADALAEINYRVSQKERTVGPKCIVAWRNRKGGVLNSGGAHQSYTGKDRDQKIPLLPTIGTGMDIGGIVGVMMPHLHKQMEAMLAGKTGVQWDSDAIAAEVAKLPDTPDEKLR
jgi:hypothetical protein